jgi:hypothetical protein
LTPSEPADYIIDIAKNPIPTLIIMRCERVNAKASSINNKKNKQKSIG